MLAIEAAVGGSIHLELAVHGFVQALQQHAVLVAREQGIPVRAPQELHHVPAGARVQALQLLDHRAVAAHRAVQALQIAVDDDDQIVQSLARGQRQPGEGLGLVHFAVADEGPDLAPGGVEYAAPGQVFHEARLIDRLDRPQTHRARGELPEIGHQPGMGIGGQALPLMRQGGVFARRGHGSGLAPVVRELRFAQTPFEKGARVDAGGRVRLEIDQVPALSAFFLAGGPGAKEMVEADLEQIRRRGIARNVAAQLGMRAVGAHHHRQRIPAHDRGQALLELKVAGKLRLVGEPDAVAVCRVEHRRQLHAALARMIEQPAQQISRALAAFGLDQGVERIEPFARFLRIGILGIDAPERGGTEIGEIGHGHFLWRVRLSTK